MSTITLTLAYVPFYLEGRDERPMRADIDTDEIAEQVIAGKGTIHELLVAAVTAAASALRVDRKKRGWLEDSEDDIKEAGGDGELAYSHYLQGRIDELVYQLEPEVLDAMAEDGGEDDDEEDEDEDDDGKATK